jgi:dolichyl-diphosphooligosaccharide--protein glycosyltransferase
MSIIGKLLGFWDKHSRIVTTILIMLVALLAFWLRFQQYLNVVKIGIAAVYPEAKLDELDTFFNYWVVSYLDKNGLFSWPTLTNSNPITCLFWYPSCRNLFATDLQGHILTIYVCYKFFKSFGISLYDLMALIPPVLGALGSIFIALLVNEVTKSKAASIVSSLTYALFFVSREVAGFTVKYSFGIFIAPLAIWLHIRALKSCRLRDFALAGVVLAYAASVWTGVGLSAVPVYLSMVLLPLFKTNASVRELQKYLVGFSIESTIPFIAMYLMPTYHGGRFILALAYYIALAFFAFSFLLHKFLGSRKATKIYAIIIAVLVASAITLIVLFDTVPGLYEEFSKVIPLAGKIMLGLGIRPPGVAETVAEYQALYELGPLPQEMVLALLLLVFIIVPIAIYNALKFRDLNPVLIAVWIALTWYATYNLSYFVDYMKMATAISIGLSAGVLSAFSTPKITKIGRITRVRYSFTQIVAILLVVVVVAAAISVAYVQANYYSRSYTMIARAEGFYEPTTVWTDTLKFIRENTSKDSLIISWWDYGYWISVIGNRSTVADGATINSTRIHILAEFFTSSYDKAVQALKQFRICSKGEVYILIFSPIDVYVDHGARNVYVGLNAPPELSFGDMPKFISAIIYLGTGVNPMRIGTTTKASYAAPWSSIGGYNRLDVNEWIVIKKTSIGGNIIGGNIGLNWNSTVVLNATMTRLYAWATIQYLSHIYPYYTVKVVPWIFSYELLQNDFGIVVDPAITEEIFDSNGLYATYDKVNQIMYDLAYAGVSQKYTISKTSETEVYRVVFIALLKLREDVYRSLCS